MANAKMIMIALCCSVALLACGEEPVQPEGTKFPVELLGDLGAGGTRDGSSSDSDTTGDNFSGLRMYADGTTLSTGQPLVQDNPTGGVISATLVDTEGGTVTLSFTMILNAAALPKEFDLTVDPTEASPDVALLTYNEVASGANTPVPAQDVAEGILLVDRYDDTRVEATFAFELLLANDETRTITQGQIMVDRQ